MKKTLLTLSLCALTTLMFSGCNDSHDDGIEDAYITLSSEDSEVSIGAQGTNADIVLLSNGGLAVVEVESNYAWTYDVPGDDQAGKWYNIVRNNDQLLFSAGKYVTEEVAEDRIVSVDIKINGRSMGAIKFGQRPSNPAVVSSQVSAISMTAAGDPIYVDVESNLGDDWIPEVVEGQDWQLSCENEDGRLVLSAGRNDNALPNYGKVRIAIRNGWNEARPLEIEVLQHADHHMVVEYTIAEENTTITMPFAGNLELGIDWGDGSAVEIVMPGYEIDNWANGVKHTYENPGVYEVSISGWAERMSQLDAYSCQFFTAVKKWGNLKLQSMYKALCITPVKYLPANDEGGFADVTSIESMMEGCTKLEEVHPDLFKEGHNVIATLKAFYDCRSLKKLPSGLFRDFTNCKEFVRMFELCSSLSTIEEGLFGENGGSNAISCEKLFAYTTDSEGRGGIENIPDGLFSNFKKCETFEDVFRSSGNLKAVPDRLFENCESAINMKYIFGHCIKVKKIPGDLFKDSPRITDASGIFYHCYSVDEIGEGIFDNLTELKDAYYAFRFNKGVTTIPAGLLHDSPKLEDVHGMFENCESLTEIPADLFANNPIISDVASLFYDCPITEIPADLFKGKALAGNFNATFKNTAITEIPEGLFDDVFPNSPFAETFAGCVNLKKVPVSLFDSIIDCPSFAGTFYGCINLEGEVPYTLVNGRKLYMYERSDDSLDWEQYRKPYGIVMQFRGCFFNCTKLTDYDYIAENYPVWVQEKTEN